MAESLPQEVLSLREKYSKPTFKDTKIVQLAEVIPPSAETKIGDYLKDRSVRCVSRIKNFFTALYQSPQTLTPESQDFVKWQILLSQVILEGQRREEIVHSFSPMELAEYLQVGYFGAHCRAKKAGKPAFFDLWLNLSLQTISK